MSVATFKTASSNFVFEEELHNRGYSSSFDEDDDDDSDSNNDDNIQFFLNPPQQKDFNFSIQFCQDNDSSDDSDSSSDDEQNNGRRIILAPSRKKKSCAPLAEDDSSESDTDDEDDEAGPKRNKNISSQAEIRRILSFRHLQKSKFSRRNRLPTSIQLPFLNIPPADPTSLFRQSLEVFTDTSLWNDTNQSNQNDGRVIKGENGDFKTTKHPILAKLKAESLLKNSRSSLLSKYQKKLSACKKRIKVLEQSLLKRKRGSDNNVRPLETETTLLNKLVAKVQILSDI